MNKWTGIGATIGGLAAAGAMALLHANQVDISTHWAETIGGIGAAIAAAAAAFITAVNAKRNSAK